jgi:hypothetical protein
MAINVWGEAHSINPTLNQRHANYLLSRKNVEKNEEDRQAEKEVRVMAGKAVLAEHCNKFSRGIQSFVNFFLGLKFGKLHITPLHRCVWLGQPGQGTFGFPLVAAYPCSICFFVCPFSA